MRGVRKIRRINLCSHRYEWKRLEFYDHYLTFMFVYRKIAEFDTTEFDVTM